MEKEKGSNNTFAFETLRKLHAAQQDEEGWCQTAQSGNEKGIIPDGESCCAKGQRSWLVGVLWSFPKSYSGLLEVLLCREILRYMYKQ